MLHESKISSDAAVDLVRVGAEIEAQAASLRLLLALGCVLVVLLLVAIGGLVSVVDRDHKSLCTPRTDERGAAPARHRRATNARHRRATNARQNTRRVAVLPSLAFVGTSMRVRPHDPPDAPIDAGADPNVHGLPDPRVDAYSTQQARRHVD